MHEATRTLLERYYAAFNAQDIDGMLDLLADDVVYDVNQGQREAGKEAFVRFLKDASASCREHIFDVEIMTNVDGSRAAAEFMVLGIYVNADPDSPPALDQTYRLPGGAFFEVRDDRIVRVSAYYSPHTYLAWLG